MQEPVLEPKNVNRFQFFIHFVTEKKIGSGIRKGSRLLKHFWSQDE